MTMLSFTYNDQNPIIIGDVLLTSKDGESSFSLPTHIGGIPSIITEGQTQESNPVDLRQKVYIINEKLAVALGGKCDQMYSFLNALQAFYGTTIPTIKDLQEFLRSYDKEKRGNLAALVLLVSIENNQLILNLETLGNWHQEEHNDFGSIFSIGTGSNDYLKTARLYKAGIGYTNPFDKALTQNLDLLSKFLSLESYTAETILNKWGAGFQLIYLFNDSFKKLDNYAFILFNGEYTKNKLKCNLYSILKYQYLNDLLLIRAADNNGEKLFKVLPLNKEPVEYIDQYSPPILKSKHYILGYLIRLPNKKIFAPTFIFLVDPRENIKIDETENHLRVTIKEWIVNQMEDEINKIL